MLGIPAAIELQARAAARAVAFNFVGIILVLVGSGFLGAALWLVVEKEHGAITANSLIGGLFVLMAGVCFLMSRSRAANRAAAAAAAATAAPAAAAGSASPFVAIAEGFAIGLQAGRAARAPRDPKPKA